MNALHLGTLFLFGFVAGMVNAVAGGGALLLYPLLLSLGIPPISANATFSFVTCPGQASSAFGYRKYLAKLPRRYYLLLIPAVLGGMLGAVMLGRTTDRTFEYIVPWFMLSATVLLAFQPALHKWLYSRKAKKLEKRFHGVFFSIIFICMFVLAVYGGYFGAGLGIIMLAFLGLSELTNIYQMSGLKNLIGTAISFTTVLYFVHIGLIAWSVLPALLVGSVLGGWFGAAYSTKLPTKVIRRIVVIIGLLVTVGLFAKQYWF
jgi:uncharacterized membrane protein YfcA